MRYNRFEKGDVIIKKRYIIVVSLLVLNIVLSLFFPSKTLDQETASIFAQGSMTGGLGYYITTVSGELNTFILLGLLELFISALTYSLKEKYCS